jgi:hypothetical protein
MIAASTNRARMIMKTIVAALLLALSAGGAIAESQTAVRARDIVKEFEADKTAAQAKYGGRPIVVTGEVRRINLKQFGTDNMILDGEFIYNGLPVWLASGNSAAAIKVGETVTVSCAFSKQNMQVEGCRFQR